MGLTHYAILNALNKKINFTIIEPNKVVSRLLKSNIDCEVFKNDSGIEGSFDLALITSPPFVHQELLEKSINRGDERVFVEKPFGGYRHVNSEFSHQNIYVGYVLRFNPCIKWIKNNINPHDIIKISCNYLSNTIQSKPSGWRNGPYSGVLNEMGSHIIDLIFYLINLEQYEIIDSKVTSLITDIDDIVEFQIQSKNTTINFHFDWVNKKMRKPVFNFEFELKDGVKVIFDQQNIYFKKGDHLERHISSSDLSEKVPYYLRGVEFTSQMEDLIGEVKILTSVDEALRVNRLMNKILVK